MSMSIFGETVTLRQDYGMSDLRSRLNRSFSERSKRPPTIPTPLRTVLKRLTGNDDPAMALLRGIAWKYRYFVWIAVVANVIAALLEAGTMLTLNAALAYATDANSIMNNKYLAPLAAPFETQNGLFLLLVLIMVGTQIGRSWLVYVGYVASGYLRAWMEGELRRRLFAQFTMVRYPEIAKHKTGDLASFVGEVNRVGTLVTNGNYLFISIIILIAYAAVLLRTSWQMTIVVVVGLLLLTASLYGLRRRVQMLSQTFLDAYVAINAKIVEFLGGMRLLHTFGRQQYARDSVNADIDVSVRAMRRGMVLNGIVPAVVQTMTVIGVALFLVGGYWWIERTGNEKMIGSLLAFAVVLYRMLPRVTTINSMMAQINQDYPVALRLANQLRHDDKAYLEQGEVPFSQLQDEIQFNGVTMQYEGASHSALDDVTLTIKRGEMVAFVGASGSGKSTVISLLLRLYDATSGQIIIDGVPLTKLRRDDWLGRIGIVDQDTFVLHDTVLENIRFGRPDATEDEVRTAADIANAHDFIMELAAGYDTVVGDRGHKLSGGQRQRLAIARAVLRNPDILILDEATSALDSHSERLIQNAVDVLRAEHTLILIAHRLSTIIHVDKIVVLHDGRIIEQGTHDELLGLGGRYHSMWAIQSMY